MKRRSFVADGKRGAWLRTIAPIIMILTLPCYCLGLSVVAWDEVIVPTAEAVGSRFLDWVFTPVGAIVVILMLLVLLTEPFHGGVTNVGAAGIEVATSIDPIGCVIILALLFLIGAGLLMWLANFSINIPTDTTYWLDVLRTLVTTLIDWIEQFLTSLYTDVSRQLLPIE